MTNLKSLEKSKLKLKSRYGGVILEYVLVTAFTLATGAAALAYITKLIREKLNRLEQSLDEPGDAGLEDLLDGF